MYPSQPTSLRRQQTIIEKQIRLEYQSSPRCQTLKLGLQYVTSTREINFSKAMREIASHGFPLDNSQIFYWDYNRKMLVYVGNFPFKQEVFLRYENFQEKLVMIHVRRIARGVETCNYGMDVEYDRKTEKRVKERSIQEVIDKVGLWRRIYDAVDGSGKKIYTLESAARQVGIAKKTLDDYYLHLKLAERFKFDFETHRHAKIGILRSFVKEQQKLHKNEKQFMQNAFTPFAPIQNYTAPMPPQLKEEVASASNSDDQCAGYLFHHEDSNND